MTICLCTSEPYRNDNFAKDGYSALCPKHKDQEDLYPRTMKLKIEREQEKDFISLEYIRKKY